MKRLILAVKYSTHDLRKKYKAKSVYIIGIPLISGCIKDKERQKRKRHQNKMGKERNREKS